VTQEIVPAISRELGRQDCLHHNPNTERQSQSNVGSDIAGWR
jgi:hypothetical protein